MEKFPSWEERERSTGRERKEGEGEEGSGGGGRNIPPPPHYACTHVCVGEKRISPRDENVCHKRDRERKRERRRRGKWRRKKYSSSPLCACKREANLSSRWMRMKYFNDFNFLKYSTKFQKIKKTINALLEISSFNKIYDKTILHKYFNIN